MQASGKSFDLISLSLNVERCDIIDLSYVNRHPWKVDKLLGIPNIPNLYQIAFSGYMTSNIARKIHFTTYTSLCFFFRLYNLVIHEISDFK